MIVNWKSIKMKKKIFLMATENPKIVEREFSPFKKTELSEAQVEQLKFCIDNTPYETELKGGEIIRKTIKKRKSHVQIYKRKY